MKLAYQLPSELGLTLKAVRLEDAEVFFKIIHSNQEHFSRFDFTSPSFSNLKEVKKVLLDLVEYHRSGDGASFGGWQNDRLIGLFTMNYIDRSIGRADVGYWLTEEAQGQGLALAGLRTLIQYCFKTLELTSISANAAVGNLRSQKVLLKAGFKQLGLADKKMSVRGKFVEQYEYRLSAFN